MSKKQWQILCYCSILLHVLIFLFVELGETSEYYHHDMYHLLASQHWLQRIQGLDRTTPIEAYSEETSSEKRIVGETGY